MFRQVRLRPGLFLESDRLQYETLVAFLTGFAMGEGAGPMTGFREFLVLKADVGNNLSWFGLARRLTGLGTGGPATAEQDRAAVDGLLDLLDEFLAEVEVLGIGPILREHQTWLQRQEWYDADLERFHVSPAPPTLTVDDAAARLKVERSAVFDLIARREVAAGRIGADVVVFERAVEDLAIAREGAGQGDG
jgi:hypothetical protein